MRPSNHGFKCPRTYCWGYTKLEALSCQGYQVTEYPDDDNIIECGKTNVIAF